MSMKLPAVRRNDRERFVIKKAVMPTKNEIARLHAGCEPEAFHRAMRPIMIPVDANLDAVERLDYLAGSGLFVECDISKMINRVLRLDFLVPIID